MEAALEILDFAFVPLSDETDDSDTGADLGGDYDEDEEDEEDGAGAAGSDGDDDLEPEAM